MYNGGCSNVLTCLAERQSQKPEDGKFGVDLPGTPDTVRWHTGQSGVPDQGTLRLTLALNI